MKAENELLISVRAKDLQALLQRALDNATGDQLQELEELRVENEKLSREVETLRLPDRGGLQRVQANSDVLATLTENARARNESGVTLTYGFVETIRHNIDKLTVPEERSKLI